MPSRSRAKAGENFDVVLCEFCCGIEVSLTKGRAPAAAPIFYKRNFESERFEYFYRGNPDVRLVITHKGIIPENDGAAFLV